LFIWRIPEIYDLLYKHLFRSTVPVFNPVLKAFLMIPVPVPITYNGDTGIGTICTVSSTNVSYSLPVPVPIIVILFDPLLTICMIYHTCWTIFPDQHLYPKNCRFYLMCDHVTMLFRAWLSSEASKTIEIRKIQKLVLE
jgi:hypothetical protein